MLVPRGLQPRVYLQFRKVHTDSASGKALDSNLFREGTVSMMSAAATTDSATGRTPNLSMEFAPLILGLELENKFPTVGQTTSGVEKIHFDFVNPILQIKRDFADPAS